MHVPTNIDPANPVSLENRAQFFDHGRGSFKCLECVREFFCCSMAHQDRSWWAESSLELMYLKMPKEAAL
jgi:hypothetical protein